MQAIHDHDVCELTSPVRTEFHTLLCLSVIVLITACERVEVGNPYENVDWQTFSHFRADLHVHTLQSDGCHQVEEVVVAQFVRLDGFVVGDEDSFFRLADQFFPLFETNQGVAESFPLRDR